MRVRGACRRPNRTASIRTSSPRKFDVEGGGVAAELVTSSWIEDACNHSSLFRSSILQYDRTLDKAEKVWWLLKDTFAVEILDLKMHVDQRDPSSLMQRGVQKVQHLFPCANDHFCVCVCERGAKGQKILHNLLFVVSSLFVVWLAFLASTSLWLIVARNGWTRLLFSASF